LVIPGGSKEQAKLQSYSDCVLEEKELIHENNMDKTFIQAVPTKVVSSVNIQQ
jgi:hypothetical protein